MQTTPMLNLEVWRRELSCGASCLWSLPSPLQIMNWRARANPAKEAGGCRSAHTDTEKPFTQESLVDLQNTAGTPFPKENILLSPIHYFRVKVLETGHGSLQFKHVVSANHDLFLTDAEKNILKFLAKGNLIPFVYIYMVPPQGSTSNVYHQLRAV